MWRPPMLKSPWSAPLIERLVCENSNHKSLGLAARFRLFACVHAKNFPGFCLSTPLNDFERQ